MGKLKTAIGLVGLAFYPASTSGYAAAVDLGSAVKAYLSVETNDLTIYGDDVLELEMSSFKKGTLNTETWLDELELESKLYGSSYSTISDGTDMESADHIDDVTPDGAVTFIRKLLKRDPETKEKTTVYRAIVLPKCTATRASQKEEADTKGENLEPKTHPVDFSIQPDEKGYWRYRADFDTEAAAKAYIATKVSAA